MGDKTPASLRVVGNTIKFRESADHFLSDKIFSPKSDGKLSDGPGENSGVEVKSEDWGNPEPSS